MVFKEPLADNVTTMRLLSKHRNSFKIANLLAHYNKHRYDHGLENSYKCLPSDGDNQLDIFNMSQGPLPIWIKLTNDKTTIEALEYILKNFLIKTTSVTILFTPKKKLNLGVQRFCKDHKWKISTFYNMTGGEDETIISLVEDYCSVLETFSRAKINLIIITM